MLLQLKILALLAVGAVAYFAVDSYRGMATALEAERGQNSQLRDSLQNVKNEYEEYGESVKRQVEVTSETIAQITANYERTRKEVKALEGLLNDHDLTHLSLKKPGLIQRRINSGTKRVFKQLEAASRRGGIKPSADPSGDSKATETSPPVP